jgi:hypothetical protein
VTNGEGACVKSETLDIGCPRGAIGKEGMDRRVDTGSGQQKAPRGNLGGEGERVANFSAIACKGRKRHEEHEESAKHEVSKGAKEVGHGIRR